MPWKARIFFPEEKLQKEAVFGCLACWPCLFFSTKHVFDVHTFAATQFGTVVFSRKSDKTWEYKNRETENSNA